MEGASPHGVLIVDKPGGPTSHDLVARLRRALGTRAIGHAGTLDPMASGVVVIVVGEATKLVPWLTASDKVYSASIALGIETDTLDAEGREVRRSPPTNDLVDVLRVSQPGAISPLLAAAFDRELARETQVPPAYSAIKVGGTRSFARARRGEAAPLDGRAVRLRSIALAGCTAEPPALDVVIEVSKGYYVRSLARDLSEALGTVGHVTRLRRVSSGCFDLAQAVSPEAPGDELRTRLVPVALAASRTLPVARLSEDGVNHARQGKRLSPDRLRGEPADACAWLGPTDELVAVGRIDADGWGTVLRGFK